MRQINQELKFIEEATDGILQVLEKYNIEKDAESLIIKCTNSIKGFVNSIKETENFSKLKDT